MQIMTNGITMLSWEALYQPKPMPKWPGAAVLTFLRDEVDDEAYCLKFISPPSMKAGI